MVVGGGGFTGRFPSCGPYESCRNGKGASGCGVPEYWSGAISSSVACSTQQALDGSL